MSRRSHVTSLFWVIMLGIGPHGYLLWKKGEFTYTCSRSVLQLLVSPSAFRLLLVWFVKHRLLLWYSSKRWYNTLTCWTWRCIITCNNLSFLPSPKAILPVWSLLSYTGTRKKSLLKTRLPLYMTKKSAFSRKDLSQRKSGFWNLLPFLKKPQFVFMCDYCRTLAVI